MIINIEHKNNPKCGCQKALNYFKKIYPEKNLRTFQNIFDKFKNGWIPEEDKEWIEFKNDR